MSHSHLSRLLIIISFMCCTQLARAQQSTSNTEPADKALREKAFSLLELLADQLSVLQSTENRVRIGSNIVGSLWSHDEKRARSHLALVEGELRAVLHLPDSDDPRDQHTRMVFLRLREDTAERVAKHDPESALAFLEATKVNFRRPPPGTEERERALELRLAKEIAVSNPNFALKLARRSLAQGLSDDLLTILRRLTLSSKHKGPADNLYKEIVENLRHVNFANDWATMHFAQRLAGSFNPPLVNESSFRDLINIFISSALANGCDGKRNRGNGNFHFCREIAQLLPQIETIDPGRAAQLKQWVPSGNPAPPRHEFDELNEIAENGSVDEILALAEKYPQIRNAIHWRAMLKAEASGDIERATRIASDYVGDPELKQSMLERANFTQKWIAMNDETMAEVQRKLYEMPQVMDRIEYLIGIANLVSVRDRARALHLLNQASGLAETMPQGTKQTLVQIGLAMFYCSKNSDRGFAILEGLVPKLNELIAAGAKLDGYETRYLRDGEWNMTGEGNIGKLLTWLAENAGYFAWYDFDRAVTLAAQFERNEIRMMAQLKLAQGILAGPPQPLPVRRPIKP